MDMMIEGIGAVYTSTAPSTHGTGLELQNSILVNGRLAVTNGNGAKIVSSVDF